MWLKYTSEDGIIVFWAKHNTRLIPGNFGEVHIGELIDKDDKTISEQVAIKTVKSK